MLSKMLSDAVARRGMARDYRDKRGPERRGFLHYTGRGDTGRVGRRRFYFAVDGDFPCDLLPADEGLILADRFEGAIIREARVRLLGAARRKAMLVRFARASASRLQMLTDPIL
jgi:hypothetical protein